MNDEQKIESRLIKNKANAPRLSPYQIDTAIVDETFTVLPSGKCMVCELTLKNGFTVRGESATVSKGNFDIEIGKDISRKNAREKIWGFEGYLLQEKIYKQAQEK